MTRIAIIGAGISGLSAAHLLNDYAEIKLFEKARGVSGRTSTRYADPYFFDHGAQYFTARTKPFQDFIQPLLDQHIIERWNARYVKLDGNLIIERKHWAEDEPRYVGVPGMNQVAKHLAENLNVQINTRIVSLRHEGKWHLTDDQENEYADFDWIISTVPSPQVGDLLPDSFTYHDMIKRIEMRACYSLMLGFKHPFLFDFEAAHVSNSDISWIAVNSHKPERSDHFTITLHSSEEYAEAHIFDNHADVIQHLLTEGSQIMGHDLTQAEYKTVHGWRYASNANKQQNNPVFLDSQHKLAACGDWCLGGRVEAAFSSAYALTNKMKEAGL